MKPKKAWRLINWAFKRMFIEQSYRTFNHPRVQIAIQREIDRHDREAAVLYAEFGMEPPRKVPMYMDRIGDPEGERYTMEHISDRWGCSGRLRFIQVVAKRYGTQTTAT